ncbi:hypothetical protein Hanom_Chr08g00731021 [Helianthus anomalus]
MVVTQEDEDFNWNKYIPKEGNVLVAEIRWSREQRRARERLNGVSTVFKEANQAKRWDDEKKCYLDPQGNSAMDSKMVDFDALIAPIPTAGEYYSKIKEDKNYVEQVEKRIHKSDFCELRKFDRDFEKE